MTGRTIVAAALLAAAGFLSAAGYAGAVSPQTAAAAAGGPAYVIEAGVRQGSKARKGSRRGVVGRTAGKKLGFRRFGRNGFTKGSRRRGAKNARLR